jgi:hypothetical protein
VANRVPIFVTDEIALWLTMCGELGCELTAAAQQHPSSTLGGRREGQTSARSDQAMAVMSPSSK